MTAQPSRTPPGEPAHEGPWARATLRAAGLLATAVTVLAVAGPLLLAAGPDALLLGGVVSAGCCAVFQLLAVRRLPAHRRAPWQWLLAACGLTQLAGVTALLHRLGGESGWPALVDVFLVPAYLATAWGVLGVDAQRHRRPPLGVLLDVVVVVAGVGVLSLTFVVLPLASDTTRPPAARAVALIYPVLDLLLLFVLARMLAAGRPGRVAGWLAVALLCAVGTDTARNVTDLTDLAGPAQLTSSGPVAWAAVARSATGLFTGFAAVGALHDDGPAAPRRDLGLTVTRLVVLALAAGLPSVVLIVRSATGQYTGSVLLGVGSLALLGLVVARIWDLLQQLRRQSDEMARMARTDPLTGVANRRSWDFELARAMAAALRERSVLLVGLLDLDHFKRYNDTQGHQAGDDLLREAARQWSLGLAGHGRVARWGGEEFAVLVHARDPDTGLATLDGLRALVPFGETCSIGVARWDGTEDPAVLLRRADEALYAAKNAGRDRTVLAADVTNDEANGATTNGTITNGTTMDDEAPDRAPVAGRGGPP
ncbi:GGDEF domain-containing protein [Kineosporia sp. J2-2]|uniref:GGDEF domain-containing protein n=1 Tax=Kineosporia corallincola TaxID=2835133 RepID=A0ABS5TFE0_9ACTN|nr:GGDEF domain-containing protein [Kineosporia corallincola]MBT0768324.1 GGDEF domain-containing protein [Kineosporia corallincola]